MKTSPLAMLLVLPLLGFGCSPSQMIQDKITEKVSESAVEGYVNSKLDGGNFDIKDGSVHVKDKDGNAVAYGENVKLPDNFPADVPVYPGMKIAMASVSGNGDGAASIIGTATESKEKVSEWFDQNAKSNGWTESQDDSYAAMWYKMYTKGNLQMTIGVTGSDTAGEPVSVTIAVNKK